MVVCFSVGASSEGVAKKLEKLVDNAKFHTYSSVDEIIKDATLRHISFNRMVLSNSIIKDTEGDLNKLNDFIKNYSSNTEIVMLLNDKFDNMYDVQEYFDKIFNSPLYVCIQLEKTTVKILSDVTSKDIIEISERYKSSTKSSVENNSKSQELQKENTDSDKSISKDREVGAIENNQNDYITTSNSVSRNIEQLQNNSNLKNEISNNKNFVSDSRVSLGTDNTFIENSEEDDDLSLGEFGSNHSDTGYLDEDDAEDLKKFIENTKKGEPKVDDIQKVVIQEESKKEQEIIVEKPIHKPIHQSSNDYTNMSNIDIILFPRNVSVSLELIDEALRSVNVDRVSVLIVDLDYKQNEILSYIDIEKFYQRKCNNGIDKVKVYTEDGVGVISNGYGANIDSTSLDLLLSSSMIRSYERIYLYCPTDCINVLSEKVLNNCNIMLSVGNNITTFIATSLDLTNRDIVGIEQEKIIMNKCFIDLEENNDTNNDLNFLREICLFANGSWIDRVGL